MRINKENHDVDDKKNEKESKVKWVIMGGNKYSMK